MRHTTLPSISKLVFIIGFCAFIGAGCTRSADTGTWPGANVLFISIDTLRADHVGTHPGARASTPNLDALARDSVVFDRAISASNHTAPSHATMFTGVSPAAHGVVNTFKKAPIPIPRSLKTLPEYMQSAGYGTYGTTDGGYVTKYFGFERGFKSFESDQSGTEKKVSHALRYIDAAPKNEPWFVFLHSYEVHSPYLIPPAQLGQVATNFPDSVIPQRIKEFYKNAGSRDLSAEAAALFKDAAKFTRRDFECLQTLYAMTVHNMDRSIGRLMQGLRERNCYDNTLIVFTSDHGDEFGEHGSVMHESLFDEILRVPLFMKFPSGRNAGARISWVMGSVHLLPTILETVALPPPRGIEGESQLAGIQNSPAGHDTAMAFSHLSRNEAIAAGSARSQMEKLIIISRDGQVNAHGFDLESDPGESKIIKSPDSKAFKDLKSAFDEHEKVWKLLSNYHREAAPNGELPAEVLQQLSNLGYAR